MTKHNKEHSLEDNQPQAGETTKTPCPDAQKNESAELKNALEELKKEKEDIFARLQRVSADYANFQKRVPKQIADALLHEKETIIKSLLPVLDNFERTINASTTQNAESLVQGVKIISDQMLGILRSHGVEQIKASGEKFDPALHEAVMQQSQPQQESGIVLQELQRGYKLNGRAIRPSKVTVNKVSSAEPAPKPEESEQEKPANDFETTDMD
jgi:molecular chaperone GrpE